MLKIATLTTLSLAAGIALATALTATQTWAQDQATAARTAAGCGPSDMQFDVKADKKQHPAPLPDSGKAMVYVFEDEKTDGGFKIGAVTTRVGLDGTWAGANHGKSYFYFPAEPGEHHLCADWQSSLSRLSRLGSAISFTAEAGKSYYFRVEIYERKEHEPAVKLEAMDQADALFQISSSALSASHPKPKEIPAE